MIKTAINNFLIWLNTPRCIEVPVFSESPDCRLYDDLYKQKEVLERRKQNLLQDAKEFYTALFAHDNGFMPSEEQANAGARLLFQQAKDDGRIDELNRSSIRDGRGK